MSTGIVGIGPLVEMSKLATGEVNAITGAETLSPTDQCSVATVSASYYAVTLPPAAACPPGMILTVEVIASNGAYVTVTNGTLTDKLEVTGEISAWINCNGRVWRNLGYSPTMQT